MTTPVKGSRSASTRGTILIPGTGNAIGGAVLRFSGDGVMNLGTIIDN